ncbi:hypothetical protein PV333_31290 [Streptomyces sp. NY05-11A]|nr:hypothetical protein [Streptomyces sp. NY05-11A]MDX2680763.1 hypothetical protein [Streptomyces sp. NY05-11A]
MPDYAGGSRRIRNNLGRGRCGSGALGVHRLLGDRSQLAVESVLLDSVEQDERGEPEQPLQEVTEGFALIQAGDVEVFPYPQDRPHQVRTSAKCGAARVNLVERSLTEDLEGAVRLRLLRRSYELCPPPQTAEDVPGEVGAEDPVLGRLRIAPERDIGKNDESEEGPGIPGCGFGGHHAHLSVQQRGQSKVELGIARTVGLVGEAGTLREFQHAFPQFAELTGRDPVSARGHVHRGVVREGYASGQVGRCEVLVLLEKGPCLFSEESRVEEAHHDTSKILTAACRSDENRAGDCLWRRRTSVID